WPIFSCAGIVADSFERIARRRSALRLLGAALLALPMPALPAAGRMQTALYVDDGLGRYGFPDGHPLGIDRQGAFLREAAAQMLLERVRLLGGREATREEIERFHAPGYVSRVASAERDGLSLLDAGDTPVFPGMYEISAYVVG